MTLKELAKQYHYTPRNERPNKDQIIFDYLKTDDFEKVVKAMRSFETYLTFFKKQDLLISKGIDPKTHKEYILTK